MFGEEVVIEGLSFVVVGVVRVVAAEAVLKCGARHYIVYATRKLCAHSKEHTCNCRLIEIEPKR
jgi:hypothetical protein